MPKLLKNIREDNALKEKNRNNANEKRKPHTVNHFLQHMYHNISVLLQKLNATTIEKYGKPTPTTAEKNATPQ